MSSRSLRGPGHATDGCSSAILSALSWSPLHGDDDDSHLLSCDRVRTQHCGGSLFQSSIGFCPMCQIVDDNKMSASRPSPGDKRRKREVQVYNGKRTDGKIGSRRRKCVKWRAVNSKMAETIHGACGMVRSIYPFGIRPLLFTQNQPPFEVVGTVRNSW